MLVGSETCIDTIQPKEAPIHSQASIGFYAELPSKGRRASVCQVATAKNGEGPQINILASSQSHAPGLWIRQDPDAHGNHEKGIEESATAVDPGGEILA